MKALFRALLLVILFAACAHAQTTTVSGSATDSNGQAYANGTYSITFNTNGQAPPFFLAGSPFTPTTFQGLLDGTGHFSGVFVPSNTSITPVGTKWSIQFCPQATAPCFVTNVVITGGSQAINVTTPPIVVNAGVSQVPQAYTDAQVTGPVVGTVYFNTVLNAMRTCTITNTPCNWVTVGSGGVSTPGGSDTQIQINCHSSFCGSSGLSTDSSTAPSILFSTNFFVQEGSSCFSGQSPWVDITCPPYNARAVQISTTATGSGTSITVGTSNFHTNDWLTIAAVGNAPTMTNPTGLTVTPMVSAGFSAQDTPSTAGMSGASNYTYTIFPFDILGGANVPLTPVSITTGNATIGSFPPITLSTENLLNNVLTLTTTSASGLPINAMVHVTGTSNNHYFGGWYTISNISGSTITINNVAQFCNPACTGTGGQIVAFVGNVLKWTPSATSNSFNSTWQYGICAQRPGDGALHLIAVTYPQSLNTVGNANTVSIFNDYGAHFNTPVPWDLSDANCTAVSAQPQRYTGKITAGGGTPTLTVTPSIPIAPTGQAARYDTAPSINAAMTAAGNQGVTFIPPQAGSAVFPINSVLNVPFKAAVIQQGDLSANAPIYTTTVSWWGLNSGIGGGAFDQSLGPIIQCSNANPCFYTGAAQQGDSQVQNITFQADHNTVMALIDSAWGEKWIGDTFQFFNTGSSDYSGQCIMVRPQGSEYNFRDIDCLTGPGIGQDSSWAPGIYADGLCGGTNTCPNTGSVGTITINTYTQSIRSFLSENNGGSGTNIKVDTGYSQGSTQPNFSMQNINGNVNSSIEIDHFNHDTESQAVFAGICGIGCASAFNGAAAVSPKIGHVSALSTDAGTTPWQVTGGGNARYLIDLAVFANSGSEQGIPGAFTLGRGLYLSQFRNYLYGGVLTSDPNLGVSDFQPNLPTPIVCLEAVGGFCNNIKSATLTQAQTTIMPNNSGVNCITGMVDCLPITDTGIANQYAGCPTVALTSVPISFFFTMQMVHANTGPITINLCSLGGIPVKKNGGTGGSTGVDLVSNDIKAGLFFCGVFDGTNIQSLCALGNSSGGGVGITGSPSVGQISCFASLVGSGSLTNCTFAGDVSWTFPSGVATSNINSIQGTPVSTSNVVPGQNLCVLAGPVYQNCYPGVNYNPQTGSYPITCPGDRFGDVDFTGSAPNPAIFTLPQAIIGTCTGFNAGFVVHNGGTVPINLQATTTTIDGIPGSTGEFIMPGAARFVYSDSNSPPNYHTLHVPTGFGGINSQTVSYTAAASDNGKTVVINSASACVFTLPATPPITGESASGTRYTVKVMSIGSTLCTVSLNGNHFNGGTVAPILLSFLEQDFSTDGTNWFGNAPIICSTNVTCTPASNGLTITATGSGSSTTIQTNGVANATQSPFNLQTSTNAAVAGRITPTNTSGGNEQFDITNLQGTDTKVATAGTISSTPGIPACSDANSGVTTTGCGPTTFGALTDGATVTWATALIPIANASLTFTTHGGSRTLNLTGLVNGGSYVLKLKQDATGGENLTGGTGCTWLQLGGGGSTFTLTGTANAIDVIAFTYDGTNCLATLGKAYN